jgi:hypothetical protein
MRMTMALSPDLLQCRDNFRGNGIDHDGSLRARPMG